MKLSELLERVKRNTEPDMNAPDPEITSLTGDSRRVRPGALFVALPGSREDGRHYIPEALRLGAAAILSLPDTQLPPEFMERDVAFIADENPRRLFALMAAEFYQRQPGCIAAVTGTNGKTSTVDFIRQLWEAEGLTAASLGTLGVRGVGLARSGAMTTPDPADLHAELADLAAAGVTHLALEASSHGLDQHRLDGLRAQVAGFTNLTQDHLDYHGDMESYFAAKARLFRELLPESGSAVVNLDDPAGGRIAEICAARGIRVLGYGRKGGDLRLVEAHPEPSGQKIRLAFGGALPERDFELMLPVVGTFQAANMLCALGIVLAAQDDVPENDVLKRALESLKGPPGRLELVPCHPRGAAVYVDYAHTPDALENVLKALRPHTRGRLICVMGCGGDRDRGKRPQMGRIAALHADQAIVTDDNPRSEDPAAIRAAIRRGGGEGLQEIGDRRAAITEALRRAGPGDVVLIAGKGHEQGQIIGERIEPFDDVLVARESMEDIAAA